MRTSVVRAYALGIITGSFLTAATLTVAFPVKADVDRVVVAYAAQYGGAVCATLDEYPTINGVYGIGQSIMEDGLTAYQAGQVIGLSVLEICPQHIDLMQNFAAAAEQVA
jgi:hypothetical protein